MSISKFTFFAKVKINRQLVYVLIEKIIIFLFFLDKYQLQHGLKFEHTVAELGGVDKVELFGGAFHLCLDLLNFALDVLL